MVATAFGLEAADLCMLLGGMPSLLPEDLDTILRMTDESVGRLQAISFFLFAILLSALVVRFLWNVLAADLSWLPRITFGKSLALVLLCGFLFVVVLTMISGARELMTPGAWEKDGITYELK